MAKKVIVYSAPGCIYCKMVEDFLEEGNVEFSVIDLSVDTKKKDEIIKKTGQMAVPVVDVEGELVIGFDKKKMTSLLGL